MIVENLPVPFDRRVWQEATTLRDAGYQVSVICPVGDNHRQRHEVIDGIHIWRHPLPVEANGALGYLLEYSTSLFWETWLALSVWRQRGFDVIHACNPPDLIFLVGLLFRLFGKRFLFDHHDLCPELYEAKFGRRDLFYRALRFFERCTFRLASVSIATNDSYRAFAIDRGHMPSERVHVVRSGPNLKRLRIVPPNELLKEGRRYLVGYVGVMGAQEGLDILLRVVRIVVRQFGRTDIHFRLLGGGTELETLKRYAKELGVEDYATFTGRVSDDELLSSLCTADICVNPDVPNALNNLSTMNKIMEYMALSKPIVQFDLKEGRFSAGEASLYARNNDELDFATKVVQLLDDPGLRTRMGQFGRHRVENELAWPYEAPKLLKAYDQLFEDVP
jgi:glycosyltransferase involved in cell wall biosynthesis